MKYVNGIFIKCDWQGKTEVLGESLLHCFFVQPKYIWNGLGITSTWLFFFVQLQEMCTCWCTLHTLYWSR